MRYCRCKSDVWLTNVWWRKIKTYCRMLITKRIHVEDKTWKVTFLCKYHCSIKDFVNPPQDSVRTSSCENRILASLFLSVCLSVSFCPSLRLEQLGYHWMVFFNEIWYLSIFRKSAEVIPFLLISLLEGVCIFMLISRWILLRMRNVSDKNCRENQNTFYVQYFFFLKSCCLWNNVEKYGRAGSHRWQYNTAHAHGTLYNYSYRHTLLRICNIYCFSTATVVTRTLVNVTFMLVFT
jgi:hypothetical protein